MAFTNVGVSITSTITDGDTSNSPDGNSVYDALALKANITAVPLHSLATAENNVLVGAPSPYGSWVKKTLAEFKTILGLGTAAYTAATAYDAVGLAASKIAASIVEGDTGRAPDGNSVFNALALKASISTVPLHSLATAENNVLVGAPTPGSWVKKTLTEFKTILGLGTAAYTASTAYDAVGTAASKIAASISNGDTTHAPDGNSVYDALITKAPIPTVSTAAPSGGSDGDTWYQYA